MITYKLCDNEADWRYVREQVFMIEQGFHEEFDEIDQTAEHITIYEDSKLVGCGRLYPKYKSGDCYCIGRIAIMSEFRKLGYGAVVIEKLEAIAKKNCAMSVELDAQCRAMNFYEKLGYEACGEIHLDEHVPHIKMRKSL